MSRSHNARAPTLKNWKQQLERVYNLKIKPYLNQSSDFFIGRVSTDYMEIESLDRRAKLIGLGVLLIISGIVIPFLWVIEHHNSLNGLEVITYEFPLQYYGGVLTVLGIIIAVIGLKLKDKT